MSTLFTNGNAVADSDALALLPVPTAVQPGTRVFNEDVGDDFVYTISTASLVPDEVVAVAGVVGARWIKFVVAEADHATTADSATTAGSIPQVDVATTGTIKIPTNLRFVADSNTGITNDVADRIDIYAGGVLLATIGAGGITTVNGVPINIGGGGASVSYNNAGSIVITPGNRQVQIGAAGALAHDAVGGFPTIPTVAGTPDGTPANLASGHAPFVIDTVANKLWAFYGGSWHDLTGS